MTDTIKPALRAEEWAELRSDGAYVFGDQLRTASWNTLEDVQWADGGPCQNPGGGFTYRRHALAALALYGQKFGFTHRDLLSLRLAIEALRRHAQPVGPMHAAWETIFGLESLADRIAALLPPEG